MKRIIVLALALCMAFCTSCTKKQETSGEITNPKTGDVEEVTPKKPEDNKKADIVLYYSDNQGIALHPETRSVFADDATNPEFVLEELIKGTENEEYSNVIPTETVINSCMLEGGVCTVDLSVDFIEIQGTASQEMAMYSVVNTLCAIKGVDKVKFLIDGEVVSLFGYYDFASPFEADMSFVQE